LVSRAESTAAALRHAVQEAPVARHAPAVFVGRDTGPRPVLAGRNHPLAISRISTVIQLARLLGWLDDSDFVESMPATAAELAAFHTRQYITALRHADEAGQATQAVRERHHLGGLENPIFPGVFRQAALAVGGSIQAADLALDGHLPFHPAGGTHHGRPDRASGFCYFNDPVFAIRRLLDRDVGRVAYVDLDAHHGDGVEEAFAGEPRVLAVSIHEAGRWPYSGAEPGRGAGRSFNLPVPRGLNDSELQYLLDEAVLPRLAAFGPAAVVVTCGADGLAGDPLAGMQLTNLALWQAVDCLRALSPVNVVLGGGGYNPWTVARCWTGLWGRLSGRRLPDALPPEAARLLSGLSCDLVDDEDLLPEWTRSLADAPNHGTIRQEVKDLAAAAMRDHATE
jgi:acetoin utilization protein AcuC